MLEKKIQPYREAIEISRRVASLGRKIRRRAIVINSNRENLACIAAKRDWCDFMERLSLSEEEKRRKQKAVIHDLAEALVSLGQGRFERCEKSLSWKKLIEHYSALYPHTKSSFHSLRAFINENGLDPFSFELLAPELQVAVVQQLSKPWDLIHLAQTCRALYNLLINNNTAWKSVLINGGRIEASQEPLTLFCNSFYLQANLMSLQNVANAIEPAMQREGPSAIIAYGKLPALDRILENPNVETFSQLLLIPSPLVRGSILTRMLFFHPCVPLHGQIIEKVAEIALSNTEVAKLLIALLGGSALDRDCRMQIIEKMAALALSNLEVAKALIGALIGPWDRSYVDRDHKIQIIEKMAALALSNLEVAKALIGPLDRSYVDRDLKIQIIEKMAELALSNPEVAKVLIGALGSTPLDRGDYKMQIVEKMAELALSNTEVAKLLIALLGGSALDRDCRMQIIEKMAALALSNLEVAEALIGALIGPWDRSYVDRDHKIQIIEKMAALALSNLEVAKALIGPLDRSYVDRDLKIQIIEKMAELALSNPEVAKVLIGALGSTPLDRGDYKMQIVEKMAELALSNPEVAKALIGALDWNYLGTDCKMQIIEKMGELALSNPEVAKELERWVILS